MSILLLMVDGVGLGELDMVRNPLAVAQTRWFRCFRSQVPVTDGCVVVPTDAALGVPGLPQSATGQTTLLTGLNAPLLAGRHIQGFCTPTLSSMLAAHSLFRIVSRLGGRVACANAFTDVTLKRPRFHSVSTVAGRAAGIRLRDLGDLSRGEALYHDFTNRLLRTWGYAVPLFSPEEAARRLIEITEAHDLTYYEYLQTDLAGHAQDMDRAVALLETLDRFVSTLVELLDVARHLLVLVSDHGNVEDLSNGSHTWNRVPTMVWGYGKDRFARRIQALTDISPTLLTLWDASRQRSA
ncbi:MAG: peptidase, partial [Candidatus Methylomirabilales bacterium]